MDQEVDVVGLAVEFAKLGSRASAHFAHGVLAEGEQSIGEHRPVVRADKHQVRVECVGGAAPARRV